MKAWRTYSRNSVYSTIVFAETAGKAKSIAVKLDWYNRFVDFTEIRVRRDKEADAYYRGVNEMDFDNELDKEYLIKFCDGYECRVCDLCKWKNNCEHYVEPEIEEEV